MQNLAEDWKKARDLNIQISIHAGSTEAQKEQIRQLADKGMLTIWMQRQKLLFVG